MRFNFYTDTAELKAAQAKHQASEQVELTSFDAAEQEARSLLDLWGAESVYYFESGSPHEKQWVYRT